MINRPFALAGFSFTLTFLALNIIDGSLTVIILSAAGCLIICCFAKRLDGRMKTAVSMLCVMCACLVFSLYEAFVYEPALAYSGSDRHVTAQIISLPSQSKSGYFYTLRASTIDGEPADCKISLFSEEPLEAEPYDEIAFRAELYTVEEVGTESYYKSKGIYLQCFWHGRITVIPCEDKPLGYYFLSTKSQMTGSLRSVMGGEEADLAVAMLTGDKDGLSDETAAAFKKTGLSHTMAVSGLHMSIIVMGLYKLLMSFMRSVRWLPGVICSLVAVGYAGVTGFSVSAVRSCIMICVMLLGTAASKRSDSLNSLGFAALVISLTNPFTVLDWSFMLSFSATLGIVLCSRYVSLVSCIAEKRIKFKPLSYLVRSVASAVLISLSATLFCLPVTVFFIGAVSLVFLPANLVTLYTVPVALVSAMLAAMPLGAAAGCAAAVCEAVCGVMLKAVYWLSSLEFAYVSTDYTTVKIAFLAVAAVVALQGMIIKNKKALVRAAGSTVLLGAGLVAVTLFLLNE